MNHSTTPKSKRGLHKLRSALLAQPPLKLFYVSVFLLVLALATLGAALWVQHKRRAIWNVVPAKHTYC